MKISSEKRLKKGKKQDMAFKVTKTSANPRHKESFNQLLSDAILGIKKK